MSEQETDVNLVKIVKFQKRLERISRRRFVKMSLLSGAAATGFLTTGSANAQNKLGDSDLTNAERIPQLDSATRCQNTQNLLKSVKIRDLFAVPLKTILSTEKAGLSENLQELVTVVEECLDSEVTLYDFFTEDIIDSFPGLDVALIVAEMGFLVPFRYSDPQTREETKAFLRAKDPFGVRTFMDAFSDYTIPEAIAIRMDELDFWDQNLAIKATRLGIWRSRPKNYSANHLAEPVSPKTGFTSEQSTSGSNECAYQSNGNWHCRISPDDKCSIDTLGYPTAGTDICP